ncbi:hypothetical protein [Isoptericola sp. BMS4]|uniref:hypothetical protein n=1 Tax=Isoptericola sp. BMS4 TaxID=2527875 RepID=UPI001420D16C|nr:hypothetical protein [Isoptericola sp. BMS4]
MTTTTTSSRTVHVFRVGDRVRIRPVPTTPDVDAGHVGVVVHITARRILPVTVCVGHHRDQYDPTELEPVDVEPGTPDAFPAAATTPAAGKATTHHNRHTDQHHDQHPDQPTEESGDGAGR